MGNARDVGACVVVIDTLRWRGCFSFWPGEGGEGLRVDMRKRTGLEKKNEKSTHLFEAPQKAQSPQAPHELCMRVCMVCCCCGCGWRVHLGAMNNVERESKGLSESSCE